MTKGHKEASEGDGMFIILVVVMVPQVYTKIRTY